MGSPVSVGEEGAVVSEGLVPVASEVVEDAGRLGCVVGSVVWVGAADEVAVLLDDDVVASPPPAGTAAPVTAECPPPVVALVLR